MFVFFNVSNILFLEEARWIKNGAMRNLALELFEMIVFALG